MTTACKNQILIAPNDGLANQLAVQLDYIVKVEGIAKRYVRHEVMRGMVAEWLRCRRGFDFLGTGGLPLTHDQDPCVRPRSWARLFKRIKEAMRKCGYIFDTDYGKPNVEGGPGLTARVPHLARG